MKNGIFKRLIQRSKSTELFLYISAGVLIFTCLGGREMWTQEHRWADIVSGMFARQDFFHPYLGSQTYYDKPLLSYWMIALVAKVTGNLTMWTLRLPSVLSGFLAIWSISRLGTEIKDKHLGLTAGWLLLTTFYFLFWARVSSADMLNLAGSLFAVTWYVIKRDSARFIDFVIFFMIVALTSLCKGLVGAVVPTIAVVIDIVLRKSWRRYLTLPVALSLIPAVFVYVAPFILSNITNTNGAYNENGLYLVYRENILRYFKPFDHVGPIYTYLVYLPIYLLPWTPFFMLALVSLRRRWQTMSLNSRWVVWTVFGLFIFFTISGSRRSYYVLPIVPFAVLMTADWLDSTRQSYKNWAQGIAITMFVLLLLILDIAPAWYNANYGAERFSQDVKQAMNGQVFTNDNVLLLDSETKLNFYLGVPLTVFNQPISVERNQVTEPAVEKWWPILTHRDLNKTIIITRKMYVPYLRPLFKNHMEVSVPDYVIPFVHPKSENDAVALIPFT